MKRTIPVFLLVLALLLSACNFPQPPQTPTPDALATAVAETLTAQPLFEETATPFPSETPVEAIEPSPTPSQTPTATVSAEDPLTWLGNPAHRDPLDSGSGFGIGDSGYDDGVTKINLVSGALRFSSSSTTGWRGWRLRPPAIQDFYLEAKYNVVSCGGADVYGIVFRAPDPKFEDGRGYYFGITCDGRYTLTSWSASGTRAVITLTSTDAINTGASQTNRIGAMVKGSNIKLYINGKLVQDLEDTTLTEAGAYGGFIGGFSGNLTVDMDEIAYWNLP